MLDDEAPPFRDRVRQRETAGAEAKGGGDGKADGADDAGEGDDAETGAE